MYRPLRYFEYKSPSSDISSPSPTPPRTSVTSSTISSSKPSRSADQHLLPFFLRDVYLAAQRDRERASVTTPRASVTSSTLSSSKPSRIADQHLLPFFLRDVYLATQRDRERASAFKDHDTKDITPL